MRNPSEEPSMKLKKKKNLPHLSTAEKKVWSDCDPIQALVLRSHWRDYLHQKGFDQETWTPTKSRDKGEYKCMRGADPDPGVSSPKLASSLLSTAQMAYAFLNPDIRSL